jgi:PEP-CTERM motif
MKKILICTSLAGMIAATANAQNENITWQAPMSISGPSDVSTLGTYFGSWAPHGSTLAVNGVTFMANSDLPGLGTSFDNSTGSGTFPAPGITDPNYSTLLSAGAFGNNPTSYSFNWNGMTSGDVYLVELWVNDGRNIGETRTETATGGANTSQALSYGSDGSGAGQFITGTFTADSTGSETISLNPFSTGANPSAQLNLLEVRDITVVPEPSSLALIAAGAGMMFFGIRRKIARGSSVKHPPSSRPNGFPSPPRYGFPI